MTRNTAEGMLAAQEQLVGVGVEGRAVCMADRLGPSSWHSWAVHREEKHSQVC
jgi:hypothetical protein